MATSGSSSRISSRPCSAVPASPTTSMSSSASSRVRRPVRTSSWSSRTNTRIAIVPILPRPRPGSTNAVDQRASVAPWARVARLYPGRPCSPSTGSRIPPKLRRLVQAILILDAELHLPVVLRRIIEEACDLVDAQYGALGRADRGRAGARPVPHRGARATRRSRPSARVRPGGASSGTLIADDKPLRLANIADSPDSFGIPADHPADDLVPGRARPGPRRGLREPLPDQQDGRRGVLRGRRGAGAWRSPWRPASPSRTRGCTAWCATAR